MSCPHLTKPVSWIATALISHLSIAFAVATENVGDPDFDQVSSRQTDSERSGWGEVSNGLRARVIPVLASMDEEAIDSTKRINSFATAEDVAFVVEVENVSNDAITLLDTRYGNSFGDSSGKANSDWFAQYLFSIDLFQADGKQIEFPAVDVIDGFTPASSALPVQVAAGKTHRFLLRPRKWLRVFSPRFDSGRYSVVVRYHGLREHTAKRIAETGHKKEVLAAWRGEVRSARTGFEISPIDRRGNGPRWGEPANGIRTAIALEPEKPTYKPGEKVKLILRLQNVRSEPMTVACGLWLSEVKLIARNKEDDTPARVESTFYSGWTLTGRVTLKPKQIVEFDAGNLGIATSKPQADRFEHVTNRKLIAQPGTCSIRIKDRLGNFQLRDGKENVLAPLKHDWTGEFETGTRRIVITGD